ncbi:MAG: trypsin-like serine protease [Bdellovibrio sp.]|nr:trypsin-like serine protease [Bdellovibrio sp.]
MMKFKRLSSTLLLGLLVAGCSASQDYSFKGVGDGIIGGRAVTSTDPVRFSTVSLMEKGYPNTTPFLSFCTGTLISKNLVVTAAHCVASRAGSDIFVGFGESIPFKGDDHLMVKAERFYFHPKFKVVTIQGPEQSYSTSYNDVALIKLSKDAPEGFIPAPILEDSDQLRVGTSLLAAGIGVTDDEEFTSAKSMNRVEVTYAGADGEFLISDQRNNKGICYGDSGGPAYLETSHGLVVVGATHASRGGVMHCHETADFTSLSKHKDFISAAVDVLQGKAPLFIKLEAL